ncbi:hypothetical protein CACET_c35160 [Clostridium aceticum]|uniref:Uncharacterized protein n=1 Tax=Clostridium aceticum TaxID=84022 RepID=A0A0D8IBU5_9CLOT|nr:hypothetical protein [Clostridium aceticum]AKL96947.1 hypothetical protein CACET_c35160 [Clostridium aceticum]KJF27417.1 hypothetical protein TZ02_07725 [Clostridium aceticum]
MSNDKMRAIKIVDELMCFFFNIDITKLKIDFDYEEKSQIKVSLQGDCSNPPKEKLQELEEILNAPRQDVLEDYYWELVGENDNYDELTLLGALVDGGDIKYNNNKLRITVYRKN